MPFKLRWTPSNFAHSSSELNRILLNISTARRCKLTRLVAGSACFSSICYTAVYMWPSTWQSLLSSWSLGCLFEHRMLIFRQYSRISTLFSSEIKPCRSHWKENVCSLERWNFITRWKGRLTCRISTEFQNFNCFQNVRCVGRHFERHNIFSTARWLRLHVAHEL